MQIQLLRRKDYERTKHMKDLLKLVKNKPSLFEQSEKNIWDDDYVSKSMLKAHLKKDLNSATREIEFV